MDRWERIPLIIFLILTMVLLYFNVNLFFSKERERSQRVSIEKRLDEVTAAKDEIETRLKETEAVNMEIRATLKAQEENMNFMTQRLNEEKASAAQALTVLREKDIEVERLRTKFEDGKELNEELLQRLEKLTEDYIDMKFQLEILRSSKEELEKKAQELAAKQDISLGTVVVEQPAKKQNKGVISGK